MKVSRIPSVRGKLLAAMGIAEALALGLPVVGGKESGAVPWMIGDAGLLVDINKPLEIAHAALQLLTDDLLYNKSVTAALRRVKAFDPELIATQYEEMYIRILKQSGAGGSAEMVMQGRDAGT